MRYTVFRYKRDSDDSSLTYIDGLGFISSNNRLFYLRSLRRSSSFLCFLILLYFICDRILIRPFTYLAYYLGLDIQINANTGWITMSESTSLSISFFVHFISLLLPLALCSFSTAKGCLQCGFSLPHNMAFQRLRSRLCWPSACLGR